jgi:hypothetical protein
MPTKLVCLRVSCVRVRVDGCAAEGVQVLKLGSNRQNREPLAVVFCLHMSYTGALECVCTTIATLLGEEKH